MTGHHARGVIAAGHVKTAEAGADVLRDGGSAFDAALAAIAMACVCEPVLCSPGGGGFAIVRSATGDVDVIDFFPQTPIERRAVPDGAVCEVLADFGTATQAFHIGPATTATPGFTAGLRALERAGATQSCDALFAAAVAAARRGVVVTGFQHHLSTVVAPILTATRAVAELYAPGGRLVAAGQRFHNPGLADALEALADPQSAAAVTGACIAVQADRGHLAAADFDRYRAVRRRALTIELGGCTVHLNPLPAAGGVLVAHTLEHLDGTDPVDMARALEATGRARVRAAGDLAALAGMPLRSRGTTHISVIDREGTAVAVTMSNGEGNGELVDDFGFMLNNVLGEEDINPAGPGGWPVDTRLSSMMCPTIVEAPDGTITALGSGGSNRIRSAIAQVVAHLCYGAGDLERAVRAPRLHVEGEQLEFEDEFAAAVTAELRLLFRDHRAWPRPDIFFGGVHSVRRWPNGSFVGVGDHRRDGHAIVV